MNQYSFSSEDDSHEKHCLEHELGIEQVGDWRGNSQERPEWDNDFDGGVLSEFDMNMDQQTELAHSFTKQSNDCSQILETLSPSETEEKSTPQTSAEEKQESTCQQPSAVTFFEQTNVSVSQVGESLVQEKWRRECGQVVNEFISMGRKVYDPMINQYKAMVTKIKEYSDKSIANLDMYCLFFRIKLQQEQKRGLAIKSDRLTVVEMLKDNQLLDEVYLNEKIVIHEMGNQMREKANKLQVFCEQLEETSSKIKILLSKAIESRKKKIQQIECQLERIDRIEAELVELILHPPALADENDSWVGKADIKCDRYLQRKYVVERETLFLNLIKETGEKLVTLLNSIFVKEEPVIFAVITREMGRYRSASQEIYGSSEIPLKKHESVDVNVELLQILEGIIPSEWREDDGNIQRQEQSSIQSLLQQLNNYLQGQIFLSSLEVDQQHILFKCEARWNAKTSPKPEPLASSPQSNKNGGKSNRQTSYQTLITDRDTSQKANSAMVVTVVLTIDRYLHLECGEKIASLKLKKTKLSRKANSIVVSERSRSITNFFTSNQTLGEITFFKEEDADKFISVVLAQK